MDDAVSRFRDKCILKTTSYNVPERARRWYIRHAEVFIKAQSGVVSLRSLRMILSAISKRKTEVNNWRTGNSGKWLMPCVLCLQALFRPRGPVTSIGPVGRRVRVNCLLIMQPPRDRL